MLNRQLSSSSSSKNKNKQKKQSSCPPRSALQDLNGGIARSNTSSTSSSSSSNSVEEAPSRGCLRFFLSNSKKPPIHSPNPHPKTLSKTTTPKSAPNVSRPSSNPLSSSLSSSLSSPRSKHSKENLPKPTSHKSKKNPPPSYLYQKWQSAKKPPSSSTRTRTDQKKNIAKTPSPDLGGGSQEEFIQIQPGEQQSTQLLQLPTTLGTISSVENCTPVGNGNGPSGKPACGGSRSGLGCCTAAFDDKPMEEEEDSTSSATATATTKTPPVQASVSPEIQSSSSLLVSAAAATPACYGAGHVVSGVIDRRKCRPRGILTVQYDNDLSKADSVAEEIILDHQSRVSLFPLPAEASMRWLLSPCDEEDEYHQKGYSADGSPAGLLETLFSLSSPNSGQGFSSDTCDISNFSNTSHVHSATSSRRVTKSTLLSPRGLPEIQTRGPLSDQVTPGSQEERKYRYNLAKESSPVSIDSLLGTGNVIQTPLSDSISSSETVVDNKKDCINSELDFVEKVIPRASLSPRRWTSRWDRPDSSFPFIDLTLPSSSTSIDFTQILNTWDHISPSISSSNLENVAPSQIRISWRDGLVSRIFEMDELDGCRCLSDDDDDANECNNDCLVSHPRHKSNVDAGNDLNLKDGFGAPEFVDDEPVLDGKVKDMFSLETQNSCAESTCTNGGDLFASGDSDWTLCYNNQLFGP